MLGEVATNGVGRFVNAVAGKKVLNADQTAMRDKGTMPFLNSSGDTFEPVENPKVAEYRQAIAKLQSLQAAQKTKPNAAPTAQPQPTNVSGRSQTTQPAAAQPQQTMAQPAPVQNGDGYTMAPSSTLGDDPQVKMMDMQIEQLKGQMQAAQQAGLPDVFNEARAKAMQLVYQRNLAEATGAIHSLSLGGKDATEGLTYLRNVTRQDLRVRVTNGPQGKTYSMFNGTEPLDGMQNVSLPYLQNAIRAQFDPSFAAELKKEAATRRTEDLKYTMHYMMDRYKVDAETAQKAAEALLQYGPNSNPGKASVTYQPGTNTIISSDKSGSYEVTPSQAPSKENPLGVQGGMKLIPKQQTGMNTGVSGQPNVIWDAQRGYVPAR